MGHAQLAVLLAVVPAAQAEEVALEDVAAVGVRLRAEEVERQRAARRRCGGALAMTAPLPLSVRLRRSWQPGVTMYCTALSAKNCSLES